MDNFLTDLYFELFESINEEKKYRALHKFPNDAENIRNDQKISDAMAKIRSIQVLIKSYLSQHGFIF